METQLVQELRTRSSRAEEGWDVSATMAQRSEAIIIQEQSVEAATPQVISRMVVSSASSTGS